MSRHGMQRSATAAGFALAMTLWVCAGCLVNGGDLNISPFRRPEPLSEVVVYGKDNDGPKLALIEVQGVISEDAADDPLARPPVSIVARVREALELAKKDGDVRGVLLRVYSPGGTVTASETIYHELQRFKQETGRPMVCFMQGLAASGGYYVSMAADELIAHPAAVTGSIGVIMSGINLSGLMQRFGVADQTLTTGPFKDSGSPLRPMRADERAYMQSLLGDLFEGFRRVVVAGRPALSEAQISQLADGRIFTAQKAKELGLIDAVGHFEDAVAALERRAGVSRSRVVLYQRPEAYRDNVYSRGSGGGASAAVGGFDLGRFIPPAGFYYVWPPALPELARP